jgi:hypothetical protein
LRRSINLPPRGQNLRCRDERREVTGVALPRLGSRGANTEACKDVDKNLLRLAGAEGEGRLSSGLNPCYLAPGRSRLTTARSLPGGKCGGLRLRKSAGNAHCSAPSLRSGLICRRLRLPLRALASLALQRSKMLAQRNRNYKYFSGRFAIVTVNNNTIDRTILAYLLSFLWVHIICVENAS